MTKVPLLLISLHRDFAISAKYDHQPRFPEGHRICKRRREEGERQRESGKYVMIIYCSDD